MYSEKTELTNSTLNTGSALSPELIDQFRKGGHRAFETIFHTFYPKVKYFLKTLTHSEELAEEVTQQVFVDLWICRERADPGKNMSAYIYTIARNKTITALKQQLRFEKENFDYNKEIDTSLTDDRLIAAETELLINLAIAKMPPKRRLVYEMSRTENKSNEEIARELHISKKVVEKHIRLAINELKEAIRVMLLLIFS